MRKRSVSLLLLGMILLFSVGSCNDKATSTSTEGASPKAETSALNSTDEKKGESVSSSNLPAESTAPSPQNIDSGRKACEKICERSKELNCQVAGDECMIACVSSFQTPVCQNELIQVMDCVTKEPVENWECGENQVASIKDAFCVAEQQKFVSCLESATR